MAPRRLNVPSHTLRSNDDCFGNAVCRDQVTTPHFAHTHGHPRAPTSRTHLPPLRFSQLEITDACGADADTCLCVCDMWAPRKLHRTVLHFDYLYVVGGFTQVGSGARGWVGAMMWPP